MIHLINVNQNINIIKDIKPLYLNSFPREERAPLFFLKYMASKDKSDFYGIYDNEKFIGTVYTTYNEDIVFVLYLAIDQRTRSKGYGSQVLSILKDKHKNKRIILNIEEVNKSYNDYETRYKRKLFYSKNGFQDTDVVTVEGGVRMEMLSYGGDVNYEEYSNLLKNFLGSILYKFFIKRVKIE